MPYTTLAAVKLELGSGSVADDTLLGTYITQVQAFIDLEVGFPFEAAADTIKYLDATDPARGTGRLPLPSPLAAITAIVNGDAVTLPGTAYYGYPYDPPHRYINLYEAAGYGWTYTTNPQRAIAVTGRWAWSVTAPPPIVRAATRMAAYWYRLKDAQVFDVTANPETGQLTIPKGIPVDVKSILAAYKRSWIRP